jgi:hypothetical protein
MTVKRRPILARAALVFLSGPYSIKARTCLPPPNLFGGGFICLFNKCPRTYARYVR